MSLNKTIEKLQKLIKDYNQLSQLKPEEFLTPEMRDYRDDIVGWISELFVNVDHYLEVYMSGVPSPNSEGFIFSTNQSDPKEKMRVLKNLTCFKTNSGERKGYKKYSEGDVHDENIGAMAVGAFVVGPEVLHDSEFNDGYSDTLTEQDRYEDEYCEEYEDCEAINGGMFVHDGGILDIADVDDIPIF